MSVTLNHPRSWCEISQAALESNMAVFRARLAEGALLGAVVKSNAYGHGMLPCAQVFLRSGADWLIVNSADEATALREAGIEAPIYICGPVMAAEAEEVVQANARVVLYDVALLDALAARGRAQGRVVPVHIKIETGNHRQGLGLADALALAQRVVSTEGVQLEGLATHFADIEDTTDHRFAG